MDNLIFDVTSEGEKSIACFLDAIWDGAASVQPAWAMYGK